MEKELKYEAAMAELQTIVRKMENDELDIDQIHDIFCRKLIIYQVFS